MKRLAILLSLVVLCSCKTKKNCDAYSIYYIPYNDSVVVTQWHEHIVMDNQPYCIFVPKQIHYYTDTLVFKILIQNQQYKLVR